MKNTLLFFSCIISALCFSLGASALIDIKCFIGSTICYIGMVSCIALGCTIISKNFKR